MTFRSIKLLQAAVLSILLFSFPVLLSAQENAGNEAAEGAKPEAINPSKIILEHVGDSHEFHFFTLGETECAIPLPVVLYAPVKDYRFSCHQLSKKVKVFMTGMYWPLTLTLKNHLAEAKDEKGKPLYAAGKVYAADASGHPDVNATVYDFSLTKNVVQMLISAILLIIIMSNLAKNMQKARA